MSLILNQHPKKLTNPHPQILQFIHQYPHLPYLPQPLFNFITFLPSSPQPQHQIFSKQQFINIFHQKPFSNSPPIFHTQKLPSLNNHYIKTKHTQTLFQLPLPHLINPNLIPQNPSQNHTQSPPKLIPLYQKQITYPREILPLSQIFFHQIPQLPKHQQHLLQPQQLPQLINHLYPKLQSLQSFDPTQ
ncbi:glutamate--tRNA ligase family protein, partial [Staphylococcus epidermidis]|uniref:glutamate--tRNA ligase family protein n=1 Tax=Staphylococcus epidermidis TaxID=1282 RepID=UPI0037DA0785